MTSLCEMGVIQYYMGLLWALYEVLYMIVISKVLYKSKALSSDSQAKLKALIKPILYSLQGDIFLPMCKQEVFAIES